VQRQKNEPLDDIQRRAFEAVVASFLLTFYEDDAGEPSENDNDYHRSYREEFNNLRTLMGTEQQQLICLLHGPGGSGKSTVLNHVIAYAKEFCENLGHEFTRRTIIITAMSGVAATLINGETTHSALGLNRKTIDEEMKEQWIDARLVFIDEISFASKRDFVKMNDNLKELTGRGRFQNYGGINMIFAGDYSQLEPVGKEPIYDGKYCPEFFDFVNCFIELNGMHRFKTDMTWGRILRRFREGSPTQEDIETINSACLAYRRNVPRGIQVACYTNMERSAVNCNVFEQYCEERRPPDGDIINSAALIMMDNLKHRTATKS